MTVARRLRSGAVGVLMIALAAGGCSRHPAKLSGEVTLNGEPLTTGVVMLSPARTGPSAYAEIKPDGSYELKTGSEKGLEPGEYVVTVAANEPGPDTSDSDTGAAPAIRPLMTPPKYADVGTSPLRITVKPGSQKLSIQLDSKSESPPEAEPAPE
jgi:hypothetical protein